MTKRTSGKLSAAYSRVSTPILCSLVIVCCLAAAFAADAWSQQVQKRVARDFMVAHPTLDSQSAMNPTYVVQDVLQEVLAQPAGQFPGRPVPGRPSTAVVAGQASEIPRSTNQTQGYYAFGFRNSKPSESEKLAAELRRLPEAQRDEAKTQRLRELLLKEFESRLQQQIERLDQILAEAKRAGEILDQREKQKDQIIERRITELLGGKDPMNWDYSPGLTTPGGEGYSRFQSPPPSWSPATGSFFGQAQLPQPADVPVPGWAPAAPASPGFPNAIPQPTQPPGVANATGLNRTQTLRQSQALDLKAAQEQELANLLTTRVAEANVARAKLLSQYGTMPDGSPDVISLGYQIQQLQREFDEARRLSESGLQPKTELLRRQGLMDAAKIQWEFRRKELENQLQVAEVDLRGAMQQLESTRRLLAELTTDDLMERRQGERDILEAEKQMLIARLEAEKIQAQLAWMKNLQASFEDQQRQPDKSPKADQARASDSKDQLEVEDMR